MQQVWLVHIFYAMEQLTFIFPTCLLLPYLRPGLSSIVVFIVFVLCLCLFLFLACVCVSSLLLLPAPPPSDYVILFLLELVFLFVFVYVCVFIPPSPPSSATFRPLWRQLLSKLERSKNAQPVPSSHHMVDVIIITIINILIIFAIITSHGGCHNHHNYHGLQNHHIIYWM